MEKNVTTILVYETNFHVLIEKSPLNSYFYSEIGKRNRFIFSSLIAVR